jgi:hypothetical protein
VSTWWCLASWLAWLAWCASWLFLRVTCGLSAIGWRQSLMSSIAVSRGTVGAGCRCGAEHPGTFRARASLAISYQAAGRTTEAIKLGERMLTDRVRLLGMEHPYTLGARANLATTYSRAGRTDAIKLLERVLADCERILGSEHPITLSTRRGLADAYRDAGRPVGEAKANEHMLRRRVCGRRLRGAPRRSWG